MINISTKPLSLWKTGVMLMQILRLNKAGQPIDWLTWQDAVCLYSRNLVCWSLGDIIYRIRGGGNHLTGRQTVIELPSIIACGGRKLVYPRYNPRLTNSGLFERDGFRCMYCGKHFHKSLLTRDHIVPSSRGGKDIWKNVVAACKRCNQYKNDYLLQEIGMSLIALPYQPNTAEYLALVNSRRILPDQEDFLSKQFSQNYRQKTSLTC